MTQWTSAETDKITTALFKAQAAMTSPLKDATGQRNFKYSTLASVREATLPALTANELVIVQPPGLLDETNMFVVHTMVIHSSGQWIASDYPICRLAGVDPGNPFYAPSQALGSAITYARRYAWLAICGQAPEDDDGQSATDEANKPPERRPQSPPKNPMKDTDTAAIPQTSQTAAGPPGVSHGSGRASALAEDGLRAEQAEIELVLRSAAYRGSENLEAIWQSLPGIHRRHFKTLLDRHLKPIALQVDEDRKADEAAEPEEVEQ